MPAPPRPNIVLIHSDQHRYDALGCHGHPLLRTPNLDRLAAEGVDFTHAFTPNPVCSPARACLMTGAWATTHGCVTIPHTEAWQPARPDLPVLTRLLADGGYRVGCIGKFHHEVAGDPRDHGAEFWVDGRDYTDWRQQQGLPQQPRHELGWMGGVDPFITPRQSALGWQADHVLAALQRFQHGGQPFFLRWDPKEPHLPNIIPQALAELYPPQAIAPWPSFPDPLEHKPPVQRRTRQRWGIDDWTWEHWAPLVSRYFAEITLLDGQIGRVLDALRQLGLHDDTLVIYSTDHGDMCGGHGMMDKHYVMYDDIMRVPLLARWPGRLPAGRRCAAFVSHELDIARTLLAAAQIDAPASFAGQDLGAVVAGRTPPRADIFSQYQGTHQGLYSQRMLREARWKYVYNPVAFDELYDLQQDPAELRNRIDDPACAAELQRLRQRMGQWMQDVNDPLSAPLWRWGQPRAPQREQAR